MDHLLDIESFRRIVQDGQSSGAAVMKGFSGDPNVAPYVDDIYAYLQARADGELGRGRPVSSASSEDDAVSANGAKLGPCVPGAVAA